MNKHLPATTLLELLIALAILGLIVIGIYNLDLFSQYQVTGSDRRAKLQYDASYVLEHMEKWISQASGYINQPAVNLTTISGNQAIIARINATRQVAYRYSPNPNYEIWYYDNYTGPSSSYDVISPKEIMPDFSSSTSQYTYCTYNPADNYVDVKITACWNPALPCGTTDNPSVEMRSRIYMPGASTN